MTFDEYCDFVDSLASPKSMETFETRLATGALGLAGEAGEAADVAKKVLFHGMEFDEAAYKKLRNEVGDIMWYVAFVARNVLHCKIEDIIDANVEKLQARYPSSKFSTEDFMKKESAKSSERQETDIEFNKRIREQANNNNPHIDDWDSPCK